jgi:hypothetical protein
MKPLQSLLAATLSSLLVVTPVFSGRARAQDDDLPDGDVDLVEKPKKKEDKKPPPPKKEEKKKDKPKEEKPPKDEKPPKEEKPPKDEKPSKPEKPPKEDKPKKGAVDDDSDILTVPADDVPQKPKPGDKSDKDGKDGKDGKAKPLTVDDVSVDDEGGYDGKARVLKSVEETPVVDDSPIEDEPPPRAPVVKEAPERGFTKPEKPEKPLDDKIAAPIESDGAGAGEDGDDDSGPVAVTTPEATDDGSMPWIITGATVGGLVLLAGAGVGGYFLVDALSTKTGSITVTPR